MGRTEFLQPSPDKILMTLLIYFLLGMLLYVEFSNIPELFCHPQAEFILKGPLWKATILVVLSTPYFLACLIKRSGAGAILAIIVLATISSIILFLPSSRVCVDTTFRFIEDIESDISMTYQGEDIVIENIPTGRSFHIALTPKDLRPQRWNWSRIAVIVCGKADTYPFVDFPCDNYNNWREENHSYLLNATLRKKSTITSYEFSLASSYPYDWEWLNNNTRIKIYIEGEEVYSANIQLIYKVPPGYKLVG